MNRISLSVILHVVFGDAGDVLDELRRIIPPYMKLGQRLAFLPAPPDWARPYTPWRRLDGYRGEFDRIVCSLIDAGRADGDTGDGANVLASLLRNGYDDGSGMSRQEICDEVLTLIGAGHETIASALGWVFERLRRHPDVLAELVEEVDGGGSDFRRAAIFEALRVRTVIDVAGRRVRSTDFHLDRWRVPVDRTVLVRITDLHESAETHIDAERFDPHRLDTAKPAAPAWLAFGCGPRRCLGADFAVAEMDVVLRTVLQHFRLLTDSAVDEKSHFLGVAHAPKLGGLTVVYRRTEEQCLPD
jgi:cytochrome P450